MKVSKAKLLANRRALITASSRLIQERGFDGAGVAEISRQAGLTEGAFYSQFDGKSALAAEACRQSCADAAELWSRLRDGSADVLLAYLDAYLSDAHVGNVATGCPIAAYASEVRRQDSAVAEAFTAGFGGMVELLQEALAARMPPDLARRRALVLMTALTGAVAMARAVARADPALSREILAAAREELKLLAERA